jgi:hypothetical protein
LSQIEYVSAVFKDLQTLQTSPENRDGASAEEGSVMEVPTVNGNISFEAFFVDYAVARR